jgi:transposase
MTIGRMSRSTGEAMKMCLRQPRSSILPMTTKPGSGKKRETRWTGYKLHISETCDEDRPHLITPVATTSAPITDEVMTDPIQQDLETSPTGP